MKPDKLILATSLFLLFLLILPEPGLSRDLAPYYQRNAFLRGPATAYNNGLLGFVNPANVAVLEGWNGRFYWASQGTDDIRAHNWGAFMAVPGLGFGVRRERLGTRHVTDYNLSLAAGDARGGVGISYAWAAGDDVLFQRENLFTLGLLFRPFRYLSVGGTGSLSTESSAREGVLELGIRPLGNNVITLFGDAAIQKSIRLADAPWSVGASVELLRGFALSGRYFESEAFTVGLTIHLGHEQNSVQIHTDNEGNHAFQSMQIGFGDYKPNIINRLFLKNRAYTTIELKGRIDYLGYRFWDDGSPRFLGIIRDIREAARDSRIGTIALNLSAMRILPEHAWEIREALREARRAGKKIVIFIDNAGMNSYHLASVADRIMMDPQGSLILPGYILTRTYLKGTLEKMGLGFEELRFFKYKSFAETFSRESMSPADREQRQALVDDRYSVIRRDVTASREIADSTFDRLIDRQTYFMPGEALAEGLVDTLCRWGDLKKVIRSLGDGGNLRLPGELVIDDRYTSDEWGKRPAVAVVYALGICAMDEGINARRLERVLRRLTDDRDVKAVVLRVDSPGGDGMASDVVAEALRKCAEKKPVIVSQGQVAASGGYWISMYGDKILAGPSTITGSIGVIAGWVYDKGASEKLGMTSDNVRRGEHADLGSGVRLPLLGIQIPARNLTAEERDRAETYIRKYYDIFVEKVAAGRGIPADSVYRLAEGRVYSGEDGLANGLIDEIGGLYAAIETAREMAGIPDKRIYDIVEIPRYEGFFDSGFLRPVSLEERLNSDPAIQFIRLMSERPGYPFPLLPPGGYPEHDD